MRPDLSVKEPNLRISALRAFSIRSVFQGGRDMVTVWLVQWFVAFGGGERQRRGVRSTF